MSDELNQQIGRLEAQVDNLHKDMSELKADIKNISAAMNKWKGAGALLSLAGLVLGFFLDLILRTLGR